MHKKINNNIGHINNNDDVKEVLTSTDIFIKEEIQLNDSKRMKKDQLNDSLDLNLSNNIENHLPNNFLQAKDNFSISGIFSKLQSNHGLK